MLKDKDRIFQNLYNDLGSDVVSSQKRGDWVNTKELTDKGRDWIIQIHFQKFFPYRPQLIYLHLLSYKEL